MAMQKKLNQFKKNKAWIFVNRPLDHLINETKYVYKHKLDKNKLVIRNQARLVVKGYNQEEKINFYEVFALTTRLKAIRLLLVFVCYMNFKFYQIDIKNIFLNGYIT